MASMTLSALRAELIRQGRIGSNVSTTVLNAWIYEAVKQLQKDVRFLEKSRSYYVREYFSMGTDEGFEVQLSTAFASLVVGVDTGQTDVNGATFAEMLSTALVTLATGTQVTFSTETFKFTIDISSNAATAFRVSPPQYDSTAVYNACYKLFGIENTATTTGQSYTGSIAPWCTSEYPLPSDFLYVKEVVYGNDNFPLTPIIYKGRDYNTGTPSYYYIRGNKLGLVPQPTDGGASITLVYYYIPADFAGDTTVHPFDEVYNYAIVYYAAYLYKLHQEDNTNMLKFRNLYEQERIKASQTKNARVGGALDMFGRGRGYDPRKYPLRRV